jgi:H/ACA ribonucleoprotein complex subunit 3
MPAIEGAFEIRRLAERSFRDGRIANAAVVATFRALVEALAALHAKRVIAGDLNEGNVLIDAAPPGPFAAARVHLIDADSLHLRGYPCTVAHERFLDPRLYGRDLETAFDVESDRYALATLLFQSLLYVHPYGGVHPAHPTLLRRAEARCSALRDDVKLPKAAARPDVLSDALRDWFARVFEHGERPPLEQTLLPALDEARWTRCGCGVEHARARCPLCTVTTAFAGLAATTMPAIVRRGRCVVRRLIDARGLVVAFAAPAAGRPAAYAIEGEAGVTHEDGVCAIPDRLRPGAHVALAGATTWLADPAQAGVAIGYRDGREIARLACEMGPFGPAFDACDRGAFRVHGDHVVDESGRRVAACPGGLSWLRVGARLGLAVYRVGRLARAVVFCAGEAGGRDVPLPPAIFAGAKLVALDATFDDGHALLSATLERAGKVERATLLFDARAELLATAHGPAGEHALLGAAGTRALAHGRVIAADEGGLVLFEANAGAFLERTRFPDAASLVSPDDALVAAPAGGLFVVGPRSIDELTLH